MFYSDVLRSLHGFKEFTLPALKIALQAKLVLPTERQDNELATLLDRYAGIDGVIVTVDGWAFGYSSRVQFGKNYGAFSIRRSRPSGATTEFNKLKNPLQVKPTFHIQAFVDDEKNSAIVGIAKTIELVRYIDNHLDQWRKTSDGETFYFVPFADIAAQVFYVDAAGRVFEKKNAA